MDKLKRYWFQLVVHIAMLLLLVTLIRDYLQNQLTANPIQVIELQTGKIALALLVITLATTPISQLLRSSQVLRIRRWLGLYSFFYASLHLLSFLVLDYRFNFSLIWEDFFNKSFVIAGVVSFLLLFPLTITSTRGWMVRLGKRWKTLHRLFYPAAILAVTHFIWQVKADIREPMIYGAIVLLLLALRLPLVKGLLSRFHNRSSGE